MFPPVAPIVFARQVSCDLIVVSVIFITIHVRLCTLGKKDVKCNTKSRRNTELLQIHTQFLLERGSNLMKALPRPPFPQENAVILAAPICEKKK